MKPIVAIKFDGSLGVNKSKDVAFSDVTIPKLWAAVLPGWYLLKSPFWKNKGPNNGKSLKSSVQIKFVQKLWSH